MEKPSLTFSFAAPKRTTQRRQPPASHEGSGADPRSPAARAMAEDIAVMLTNDDAAVSKLYPALLLALVDDQLLQRSIS